MSEPRRGNEIYWNLAGMLRTQMPILVGMAALGIVAGIILDSYETEILTFPSILVLVPALIGIGGNLGTIYGSRLATAIHLGILEFRLRNLIFRNNIAAVAIASTAIFIILGLAAYAVAAAQGVAVLQPASMLLLSVASGLILIGGLVPTALAVAYISYKRGVDPDDTIIPTVTSLGDIFGLLALFAIITLLL